MSWDSDSPFPVSGIQCPGALLWILVASMSFVILSYREHSIWSGVWKHEGNIFWHLSLRPACMPTLYFPDLMKTGSYFSQICVFMDLHKCHGLANCNFMLMFEWATAGLQLQINFHATSHLFEEYLSNGSVQTFNFRSPQHHLSQPLKDMHCKSPSLACRGASASLAS